MSKAATMESVTELAQAELDLAQAWEERLDAISKEGTEAELDAAREDALAELMLGFRRISHHARTGRYAVDGEEGRSPRWPKAEHEPGDLRGFAQEVRENTWQLMSQTARRQMEESWQQARMQEAVRRLRRFAEGQGMKPEAGHRGQQFSEKRLFWADFSPNQEMLGVGWKDREEDQTLTCTGSWGETELEAMYRLARSVSGKLLVIRTPDGGERRLRAPELMEPDRRKPEEEEQP